MKKWEDVSGFMKESEMDFLQGYARDKTVLEIGSYKGRSTLGFSDVATMVYCVDTFRGKLSNPSGERGGTRLRQTDAITTLQEFTHNIEGRNNIRFYVGESHTAVPKHLSCDDGIDFFFIDGGHSYENVVIDTLAVAPLFRPGGIIAYHDWETRRYPGIAKATTELFNGLPLDHHVSVAVFNVSQYIGWKHEN